VLLKNMIADGYGDARTLQRRIKKMEAWLANPHAAGGRRGRRVRRTSSRST
jgi:aconitase B